MKVRINDLFQETTMRLAALAGVHDLKFLVTYLLQEGFGIHRTEGLVDPEREVEIDKTALDKAIEALLAHRPIDYVLGHARFLGLDLIVNESVLIPRPETEEIAQQLCNDLMNGSMLLPNNKVLDVCTGSGCLALSLADLKQPKLEVHALDLSLDALHIAKENAQRNKLNVTFHHKDLLAEDFHLESRFGLWVSNPPYVPASEWQSLEKHVKDYEPKLALWVPDHEPLLFYERILSLGEKYLEPKGWLVLECHSDFAGKVQDLATECGFGEVSVKEDFRAAPRSVWARRK